MLLSINNTFQPINDKIYSTYGSLGVYPHNKVHIDLKLGTKPVHHHAYLVPHVHQQSFKKELNDTVNLGILEPCGASEWASLTFVIPKKDG